MENRKHPRINAGNLQVDISDGWGFFSGSVNNLSRFGLCLREIPARIDPEARRLSVVVTDQGKHFKMLARPRWVEEHKRQKSIGLELINAPWGWTEYVIALEPPPEDPWSEVSMS